MNIAVVGAGFYGCYLAYKLKNKYPKSKILLFEKEKKILSQSALNNQYRLHQGFHYPRSEKTIRQTFNGEKIFKEEFKKYIFYPKKNIYAIHKNSKISFNDYKKVYKRLNIPFNELSKNKYSFYFEKPEHIEGAILTSEGVILLDKLYKDFKKKYLKNINIFTNTEVTNINNKGFLKTDNKKNYSLDLIFNTTNINPNLGLKNKYFKLKYEIAVMAYVKNFYNRNIAITIMDGNFISVYPLNSNLTSLSSVKFTPVFKTKSVKRLIKFKNSINPKNYSNLIINDIRKYLKIPKKVNVTKMTFSPKVKLIKDTGSKRIATFYKEKKIISIMCGKLDAVPILWSKINKII